MQRRLQLLSFVLASLAFAVLVSACATTSEAKGRLVPAPQPSGVTLTLSDRKNCDSIKSSDLRSPQEGLWFQGHCLPPSKYSQGGASTNCNRPALETAEFIQVAPGLYTFRRSPSTPAFLWFATAPDCFDLVTERVVTAVCVDRAVSFKWDTRAGCTGHGGVLALING